MRLILDLGSGRSTHNSIDYTRRIIDSIKAVDSGKHEIVLKFQLFIEADPNIPLDPMVFEDSFFYAKELGYQVTSSVFDIQSLQFLLRFNPCFVKIACRPELYWLAGEVPRKIPVYLSWSGKEAAPIQYGPFIRMFCVPKYPAEMKDYPPGEGAISDHTVGWKLFKKSPASIWEKHYVLEREPDNPDAGPFAVTQTEFAEIM